MEDVAQPHCQNPGNEHHSEILYALKEGVGGWGGGGGCHLLALVHPVADADHIKVLFDEVLAPREVVVLGEPFGDLHGVRVVREHRVEGARGDAVGGKHLRSKAR